MGVGSVEEPNEGNLNNIKYSVPVDSENKAKKLVIWSFANPHMMAFQVSWFSFFITFVATFAPAALLPVIRQNLNLTKAKLGDAGTASVCGAIAARVGMGTFVDTVGPRYGIAATMLLVAPAVFCMAVVSDFTGFLVVRLMIGCSLCTFVCCQFWCGTMFNVKLVGTANAIAGGWGNMGGGATALLMPLIYEGIRHGGVPGFEAWRWSFFVPGGLFILTGIIALLCTTDSPQGDYRIQKAKGQMGKGKGMAVFLAGVTNYRTWILALTYGYCFGVELTVDNVIVEYLYDEFELSITTAGALGAIFGLMNIFSRASGGMLSDIAAKYWGMRGRLWCLWIIQTLGGVFCIIMALVDHSLGATIGILIVFSIFCQQACGSSFGVVPFISRRSYGVVSGIVGAGGNAGAAVTQAIFFAGKAAWQVNFSKQDGFQWMGVMTIAITATLFFVHFPQWGSMFLGPNPDVTEEDYYLKEWTAEEVAGGLHNNAMKFAMESRSQRGARHRTEVQLDLAAKGGSQKGFAKGMEDPATHQNTRM